LKNYFVANKTEVLDVNFNQVLDFHFRSLLRSLVISTSV